MTGAVIGSAVIGGISSYNQSKNARRAANQQNALNRESMELQERNNRFNQSRYMDSYIEYNKMKDIYGDLQEDLSTYYKNLSGESLSAEQIEQIESHANKVHEQLVLDMSRRGMSNSGLESYLDNANSYNTEIQKAKVRRSADEIALNQKMKFLNYGNQNINQTRSLMNQESNAIQNGVNSQSRILNASGNNIINQANQQNAINRVFTDNLQTTLGYYSRLQNQNIINNGESEGMY